MSWSTRSAEEQSLLNPGFCSIVLWYAARDFREKSGNALPFGHAFLVLPVVLHRETREALPMAVSTSLAVWLDDHSFLRAQLPKRVRSLVPYTKEALSFGGLHNLLEFRAGTIIASGGRRAAVEAYVRRSSAEVRFVSQRAAFLGRWLAVSGSVATVFAFIGIRP